VFASETEANDFYKKVAHRGKYAKGEGVYHGQKQKRSWLIISGSCAPSPRSRCQTSRYRRIPFCHRQEEEEGQRRQD
jgi:hypothetical protein